MSDSDFASFPDDVPIEVEQRILSLSEVFVYKVPPLRTASGHRAEEWGLENPLFTGHIKVFQSTTRLKISLYAYKDTTTLMSTDENLILFGECPIEIKPSEDVTPYVDAVIDSSRYFVLKLKDPKSTRTQNIGIGFRERETAFDLKNALNEYVRYIERMAKADEMHSKVEGDNDNDDNDNDDDTHDQSGTGTLKSILGDLSLKQGAKIHVNSKFTRSEKSDEEKKQHGTGNGGKLLPPPGASASGAGSVFTLAPPPQVNSAESTAAAAAAAAAVVDDDDFGDFEG
jgi:adaptin ear-binding coat-associated protein 1/2